MALSKHGHIDFRGLQAAPMLVGTAGVQTQADPAVTGADTTTDVLSAGGLQTCIYHGAATAIISPLVGATGWGLPVEATANDGCIVFPGQQIVAAAPYCFTVGTDPAFFMRFSAITADITTVDAHDAAGFIAGGFRTAIVMANANCAVAEWDTISEMSSDANATPFPDVAMLATEFTTPNTCLTLFKTNSAAGADTVVAPVAADGTLFTFEVRVSAAGVVTCLANVAGTFPGAALTAVAGSMGTLTNGIVVTPSVIFSNGAATTAASAMILQSLTWGYV